MQKEQTVRTVEATGTAKVPFDHVGFSVTITKTNVDGPCAKEDARPVVDQVLSLISELFSGGLTLLVEGSQRVSFSLEPNYVYADRGQVQEGYNAVYAISFRTTDLDRASEIMDRLTSVSGVQVAAPDFRVDDTEALYRSALEDAKRQVDAKFATECAVLDLDPEEFEVCGWNVREAGNARQGKAMAVATMAASREAPPVQLEAGTAAVSVTLYVSYRSVIDALLDAPGDKLIVLEMAGEGARVEKASGDPHRTGPASSSDGPEAAQEG